MIVYVEKKVLEDPAISGNENFGAVTRNFCTFREGVKRSQLSSGPASLPQPLPWASAHSYLCCCCCCSQTWTTYPTSLTSSSVWVEMEPCCTHPHSSRSVCVCVSSFGISDSTGESMRPVLSVGECSSSHGLPPGLAGLSDAFQIRNLPVSGHPGHRRYPTGYPRPVCQVRCTSRGLS